ncbi:hypothetical protein GGS26DRAFT_591421 [Hypomontagnella submonticulosa]|nr:hypothetical protein GGS26DRAFT_591421 [Hypomontagnella submonticulosa]
MTYSMIINLLEEPIEEGEFRTRNKPGEKFRRVLVDRGNQLHTKVDIVGITHGKLTKGGDSATLLNFEFQFVAMGGRRFKRASISFKFEDSEGQLNRDPIVHAISPDGKWAIRKTDKVQNVRYGANSSINTGTAPLGAQAGLFWEVGEVKSREPYTALAGTKRIKRRGFVGEENVVIWTMEENEDKEDGIPTFMRAAILLKRPEDVPFTFTVKVETDVDFIGAVKTFWGLEPKDPIDPVEIDIGRSPKAGSAAVRPLDPTVYDLNEMGALDLLKVADVKLVTPLDRGELRRGGLEGSE